MIQRLLLIGLAGATVAGAAEPAYRYGHVRHVEPVAALQRASEADTEEVQPNAPFLPGDRLWTEGRGRVELQLIDGSLLWLASGSKLDYAAQDADGGGDRAVFHLWSGTLAVRTWQDSPLQILVETPTALIEMPDGGLARVDADPQHTILTVREGTAWVRDGGSVPAVGEGQQVEVAADGEIQGPWPAPGPDGFDDWADEREAGVAWAESRRYLPEALEPYAGDLDQDGTWYYEADVGHVWRPHVTLYWEPYTNGHWAWTPFGWTWIPSESWGWAPFHYGRWGYSARMGWYWAPASVWAPAWVSWAVGRDYVGWCALDRWNRPVRGPRYAGRARPRRHGEALSRGARSRHPRPGAWGDAWQFVRRGDFGAHDVGARRVHGLSGREAGFRHGEATRLVPTRTLTAMRSLDPAGVVRLAARRSHRLGPASARRRARGESTRLLHRSPGDERVERTSRYRRSRLLRAGEASARAGRARAWTRRSGRRSDDDVYSVSRRRRSQRPAGARTRDNDRSGARERRTRVLERLFRPLREDATERRRRSDERSDPSRARGASRARSSSSARSRRGATSHGSSTSRGSTRRSGQRHGRSSSHRRR